PDKALPRVRAALESSTARRILRCRTWPPGALLHSILQKARPLEASAEFRQNFPDSGTSHHTPNPHGNCHEQKSRTSGQDGCRRPLHSRYKNATEVSKPVASIFC